jgi:hypothetical protein
MKKETVSSASFLDIYLQFDTNDQLSTRLYGYYFAIINFPHLDSTIPNAFWFKVDYYFTFMSDDGLVYYGILYLNNGC